MDAHPPANHHAPKRKYPTTSTSEPYHPDEDTLELARKATHRANALAQEDARLDRALHDLATLSRLIHALDHAAKVHPNEAAAMIDIQPAHMPVSHPDEGVPHVAVTVRVAQNAPLWDAVPLAGVHVDRMHLALCISLEPLQPSTWRSERVVPLAHAHGAWRAAAPVPPHLLACMPLRATAALAARLPGERAAVKLPLAAGSMVLDALSFATLADAARPSLSHNREGALAARVAREIAPHSAPPPASHPSMACHVRLGVRLPHALVDLLLPYLLADSLGALRDPRRATVHISSGAQVTLHVAAPAAAHDVVDAVLNVAAPAAHTALDVLRAVVARLADAGATSAGGDGGGHTLVAAIAAGVRDGASLCATVEAAGAWCGAIVVDALPGVSE